MHQPIANYLHKPADLLCYLDRSNIGNAKVLNSETHNDLLQETHMTTYQYTIALMVFLVAYAVFEVSPGDEFGHRLPLTTLRCLLTCCSRSSLLRNGSPSLCSAGERSQSVLAALIRMGPLQRFVFFSVPLKQVWASPPSLLATRADSTARAFPGLSLLSHILVS